MKAYGFPLYESFGHIVGICVDETGKQLGQWTSSSMSFLESDLKTHAKGYDYEFYERLPDEIALKVGAIPTRDEETKSE
jgi:hypothetical protein